MNKESDRIKGYTMPSDIPGMAKLNATKMLHDLCAIAQFAGETRESFLAHCATSWDVVEPITTKIIAQRTKQ